MKQIIQESDTPTKSLSLPRLVRQPRARRLGQDGSVTDANRLRLVSIGFVLLFGFMGCTTAKKDGSLYLSRFYLEASPNLPARYSRPVTLPMSGLKINISPVPVLTESEIINIELVKVEMGLVLLYQFNPEGTRILYRVTTANQGRRLILMLNDEPVGVRMIDGPVASGNWLTFTELSEGDLSELVLKLRETTVKVQKKLKNK